MQKTIFNQNTGSKVEFGMLLKKPSHFAILKSTNFPIKNFVEKK
jgi:hypothetical protein